MVFPITSVAKTSERDTTRNPNQISVVYTTRKRRANIITMAAKQATAKVAKAVAVESLSTPSSRAAFSAASGSFAGMVSAITGLGGAVVFVPALSRLGFKAKDIVGTTVAAVTGATAAGSLAYAQKGVTGTTL